MRRNKLSLLAGLALAVAGCASDGKNPSDALSYDPNLGPGEMFFNPNAAWAKAWTKSVSKTKPDEEPQKIPQTVINGGQEKPADKVPWTILNTRTGKVEALAAGVKPAEVLKSEPARLAQATTSHSKRHPASTGSVEPDGYNWQLHRVAKIPFRIRGDLMNGYFFVRQRGESWRHLSQVVYGTESRESQLQAWNDDKPLKVGAVLYFNSPHRPKDERHMLFIADDFNQSYSVTRTRRGEPLSLLAVRLYGQWRVWREIAYFNGLKNPHALEKNTLLRIAPVKLGHEALARSSTPVIPPPTLRTPAGTRDSESHR